MKIYYDSEFADELTQKLTNKFWEEQEARDRIHLSDTTKCPIKCWCRLTGIKPHFSTTLIGMFAIGVVGQEIFQALYPPEQCEYEPDKDLPLEEQLPAHIDIFADFEVPLEIKWSRRSIMRGTDISKGWILQTTGYMAKTNSVMGRLIIFNIMSTKINVFKVIMTEIELEQRRNEIEKIREEITRAVEEKNPNLLEAWVEECKYCTFRDTRTRKKEGLGAGCPRYKGRLATTIQHLSST